MKKYRVWFHYYKQYKCMSVHFRGTCYRADDVECHIPVETKWNNRQPHLVLQGWANEIEHHNNKIIIK